MVFQHGILTFWSQLSLVHACLASLETTPQPQSQSQRETDICAAVVDVVVATKSGFTLRHAKAHGDDRCPMVIGRKGTAINGLKGQPCYVIRGGGSLIRKEGLLKWVCDMSPIQIYVYVCRTQSVSLGLELGVACFASTIAVLSHPSE